MAESNSNIIYIYDDEHKQIISIDAETGERMDRRKSSVLQLLIYLNERSENAALRKFTVWCAHQTNKKIKPIQNRCLQLAEKAISDQVDNIALQKLYEKMEGAAIAIDTVGLRQESPQASGFLVTRECVNPDAYKGAKNAMRYYALWAEMKGSSSNNSFQEREQKQIDCLLDILGDLG